MAKQACSVCAKESKILNNVVFQTIRGQLYCSDCGQKFFNSVVAPIVITTTSSIEGHRIKRYIDVESVEVVIGTGAWSEFTGDVSDFFGARSTAFEQKLKKARKTAVDKLRWVAAERGGNAVVGVDLDFTEFAGNRVGLIVNGTVVEVDRAS